MLTRQSYLRRYILRIATFIGDTKLFTLKGTLSYQEAEILAQIAGGSEQAFATLFHKYRDKVYSVAFRLTESTFLAEEVVQDLFLKLWIQRGKLSEIKSFEDYLFIMARNQVFSALRRIALQKNLAENLSITLPQSANSTYEDICNTEYDQMIRTAIDQLPHQQREIYILSKEKELKRDEIAQLLHISPETVKTHLSRAIRHIRAYILPRMDIWSTWFVLHFLN